MNIEDLAEMRARWITTTNDDGVAILVPPASRPRELAEDAFALMQHVIQLEAEKVEMGGMIAEMTAQAELIVPKYLQVVDAAQAKIRTLEAEKAALRKALHATAVLTGRTSDARLHIEHAREINRKEIPYKERLDSELIDALTYLEAIHDKARELVTTDHQD
jgi:hypothetical protein